DIAFTVVDALSYLDEIPVCVAYEIDGKETKEFPVTPLLEKAKPVLKVLPGWKTDIRGITKYEDLPENCKNYIEFIEKELGFHISIVSNGPKRHEIMCR
ncbi:MAG: adenylosuccinate synthetase, partial [Clostridia bacterium]|nr:adenylosuccinate synthetase [Clostridia bacterium]